MLMFAGVLRFPAARQRNRSHPKNGQSTRLVPWIQTCPTPVSSAAGPATARARIAPSHHAARGVSRTAGTRLPVLQRTLLAEPDAQASEGEHRKRCQDPFLGKDPDTFSASTFFRFHLFRFVSTAHSQSSSWRKNALSAHAVRSCATLMRSRTFRGSRSTTPSLPQRQDTHGRLPARRRSCRLG